MNWQRDAAVYLQVARNRNATRLAARALVDSTLTRRLPLQTVLRQSIRGLPQSSHVVSGDGFRSQRTALMLTLTLETTFSDARAALDCKTRSANVLLGGFSVPNWSLVLMTILTRNLSDLEALALTGQRIFVFKVAESLYTKVIKTLCC